MFLIHARPYAWPVSGLKMRHVVDRYLESYNSLDSAGMLLLMDPDVIFEHFAQGALTVKAVGIHRFRELAEQSAGCFRSRKQTILGYQEDGASAWADIRFEGVLAVDLPDGLKAGQAISLEGRSEFRFSKGLIVYLGDHS